ncbi:hypothetical protein K2X05_14125 [bacterium]|nr:hypothetical protein [bacterium]
MKSIYKKITTVLFIIGATLTANAAPTIDSLNVQGFMKTGAGSAVTNGTYTIHFGVFQNSVPIWGRTYSVPVTSGLFSRSLSGLGSDLSGLPGATGMNSDFSAVTLNAALLMAGGSGGISVRVYGTAINSTNPQFDITYSAVPTAMVAEVAKGVAAGSVTVAGIATASKVSTSAGAADVGKLALLDSNGRFDVSFIPTTIGGSGNVSITPGAAGTVAVGSSSTGTASFGNTGANAVSTLQGGSGASGSASITSAGTAATAVNITATNTTGGITIQPLAGGSGTITIGSTSTGASVFGNTGVGSTTTLQGATVNLGSGATTTAATIGGTGLTTLDIGTAATGTLITTIGSTAVASSTRIQAGTGGIRIGSSTGFTAMGGCTITAAGAITNTGAVNRTCTGVPASAAVAVACSAASAFQTPATTVPYCRSTAAGNQVSCITSVANNVNNNWSCVWMQP